MPDKTRAELHQELAQVRVDQEMQRSLMMPLTHDLGSRHQKVVTTVEKTERGRRHFPIDPKVETVLLYGIGGALALLIVCAAMSLILWAV